MTIKRALAPWMPTTIEVPPWQASLSGPIWMLNQPGTEGSDAQGGDGGGGTAGQGAGTTDNTTGTEEGDAQGGAQSSSDETVSRSDFERLRNQLSAADQKRQQAEQKLQEIADKDKSELDRATERAAQAEAKVAQLEQEMQELRLERTMLTDAEYGADKWHDPEDVLVRLGRAVKDQQITLKDGQPDGAQVKSFLKDLAKKANYLLKPSADSGANGRGASGQNVGGGDKRGAGQGLTDEQLAKKYRIK